MADFAKIQEQNTDRIRIKLSGNIDEEADFSKLPKVVAPELVLDLEDVSLINSCGTREWVKWIRTIDTSVRVVLNKCPRAFIDQANMFDGLFPHRVTINSFYIPYFCTNCKSQIDLLLTWGKEVSASHIEFPESVKCEKCGLDAEPDIIESIYFKFIKKIQPDL